MAKTTRTMIVSPSMGKFYFDAVFSVEHTSNVTVTQHPVQVGASISDHSYMEPDTVTLEIGMSDAMSSAGSSHSVNAYTQLRAMMDKRERLKLVTRLKTYTDMVITSMSAPDDATTMNALRATIIFTQVNVVGVSVVKVQQTVSPSKSSSKSTSSSSSKDKAKTSGTTKTTKSTQSTSGKKQSVLSKLVKGKK